MSARVQLAEKKIHNPINTKRKRAIHPSRTQAQDESKKIQMRERRLHSTSRERKNRSQPLRSGKRHCACDLISFGSVMHHPLITIFARRYFRNPVRCFDQVVLPVGSIAKRYFPPIFEKIWLIPSISPFLE